MDLDGYGMICARRKGNGRMAYTDWSGDYEVATGSGIWDLFCTFPLPVISSFGGKGRPFWGKLSSIMWNLLSIRISEKYTPFDIYRGMPAVLPLAQHNIYLSSHEIHTSNKHIPVTLVSHWFMLGTRVSSTGNCAIRLHLYLFRCFS